MRSASKEPRGNINTKKYIKIVLIRESIPQIGIMADGIPRVSGSMAFSVDILILLRQYLWIYYSEYNILYLYASCDNLVTITNC